MLFKRGLLLSFILMLGSASELAKLLDEGIRTGQRSVTAPIFVLTALMGILQFAASCHYRSPGMKKILFWILILELLYYLAGEIVLILSGSAISIKMAGTAVAAGMFVLIITSLISICRDK